MMKRSQKSLLPLTLSGSKIELPAVSESVTCEAMSRGWKTRHSLSLHRHFTVLLAVWAKMAAVSLDTVTAMALARGNPEPSQG